GFRRPGDAFELAHGYRAVRIARWVLINKGRALMPNSAIASRRGFLELALGAGAAVAAGTSEGLAQRPWPNRLVRIIVPFAAGGATDLVARPWADALGKAFNQQFVIENRGGAQGLIGAEAAYRSPPDGYTYYFSSNSTIVFQPLLRKVNYDSNQFVPVARMGTRYRATSYTRSMGS